MTSETAFACGRRGLRASLASGLLGGYDGAGAWSLHLDAMKDPDEQQMVEHHEGLHHELQASSAWGLTSAMSLMLARRGSRPHTLGHLFDMMVDAARETHECFATSLSVDALESGRGRRLLAGNPTYLGYLDRALSLAPAGAPWQFRSAAIAATLRAVMAPAVIMDVLDSGFGAARWPMLDLASHGPDQRLSKFEAVAGAQSWAPVFAEILLAHPDRGGDSGDEQHRGPLPDSDTEVERLRLFEEEVLLPRCHNHVRSVLEEAGMPTLAYLEQSKMAEALIAAVTEVDPELGGRLQLVTERRPILDDALEYDRQAIRLRDRLTVELLDPEATIRNLPAFRATVDGEAEYVCAVWLAAEAARKQFSFPPGSEIPETLAALLVRARAADGRPLVRIGMLPPGVSPRGVQDLLGDVPVLVLSTHYTLTKPRVVSELQRVEPVFVLMDLPVAWHVDDWIRQGATVRYALAPLTGDLRGELWLTAFKVDRASGLTFLSIGGKIAMSMLVERLRRRHPDDLLLDGNVVKSDMAGINLALSHVAGTWHVLDQAAVE